MIRWNGIRVALAVCAVIALPATVWGFRAVPETGLEVHQELLERLRSVPPVTSEPAILQAVTATAGLDGDWIGRWNRLTGTPQRLIGPGLMLAPGGVTSHAQADQLSRGFMAARPQLFGVPPEDLETVHQTRAARHWSVIYRQTHAGIPVEGTRVDFLYFEDGRLLLFGAEVYADIELGAVPTLSVDAALLAAQRGMPAARLAADGAPELRILPLPTDGPASEEIQVVHHLAYRMVLDTDEPVGRWITWVDAHTGRVLWRLNDIHFLEITGNVSGDVEDFDYCDGFAGQPLQNLTVNVSGAGSGDSDANGDYSITVPDATPRLVTAELLGAHVNVNVSGAPPDASFSDLATPGVPLDIVWDDGNSRADERDVYLHTDRAYRFIRNIDPTTPLGLLDGALIANVNVAGTCNAFWNGTSINFYDEGGGCANTGRIGDVVYHEYGHGLTQFLYSGGPPGDMHEGNSDIMATHIIENSIIGNGFFLGQCGLGIRDCDNELRYPEDVVGQEAHAAGSVICGFDWDVRKGIEVQNPAIFESRSDSLWHVGRMLLRPQSQPAQVELYFIFDDDDGNVFNGTPHYDSICQAAVNHGFEPLGPASVNPVTLSHLPLHSTTDDTNPYEVVAIITSSAGSIDVSATKVIYRVNGGTPQEAAMSPTGAPDEYHGFIPAQPVGSSVSYAIQTADDQGNAGVHPPNPCFPDQVADEEQFFVATVVDELEVDSGWTVGAPDDDATTGIWERVDPNGTAAQPEDDRTPVPGTMCFVTGQCPPGCGLGDNDVDNGKTTLFSPVYDLAAHDQAEILYHRWYSNNTGAAPNQDIWVVDASNDGGATWVNVETTNVTEHAWKDVRFNLNDLFGAQPNLVQLRFVASDTDPQSLVEAGVDELMIIAGAAPSAVDEPSSPLAQARFELAEPVPNPFNPSTAIGFDLPERAAVSLEIFDVAGRRVRTLVDRAVYEAGRHTVAWDGRGAQGEPAASGIYYVRMTASGFASTRKLALLK